MSTNNSVHIAIDVIRLQNVFLTIIFYFKITYNNNKNCFIRESHKQTQGSCIIYCKSAICFQISLYCEIKTSPKPSRHEAVTRCWFDVGPTPETMAQHQTDIWSICGAIGSAPVFYLLSLICQ